MLPKFGKFIPHYLTEISCNTRMSKCTYEEILSFLDKLMTGYKKLIFYNIKSFSQWFSHSQQAITENKMDLHPRKVLISI